MQLATTAADFPRNRLALAIAALAALLAASAFYTPLPLIIAVAIPSCAYFITRPYELLLVMVFLIPFNFVFLVGSVPVAFELAKVLAWIPFLYTLNSRRAFIGSRFTKWFAILGGLIFLSLFRSNDLPYTLKESVRLGSNLGLVYLTVNLVDTREKVLQVMRVLAVSTFLVACYGFYQWAIQDYGALFWLVNPRLDTSLAHYRDSFWEWRHRIISVLTSEMELGHYFNLCLPIGAALWVSEGHTFKSKWLWITLAMLAGLVLTFTFSAWLALAATCVIFAYRFRDYVRWRLVVKGLALASLLATVLAFGPLRPVIEAKAGGTGIGSLAWDAATRLLGWKLALQVWWAHPIIGAGIGNFETTASQYDVVLGAQSKGTSPHEAYVYLLANTGLLGTISILVVMLGSIRRNLAIARSRSAFSLLGVAFAFALITNMVGWFGDDSGFFGPHASYLVWLLIGLGEVIANLATQPDAPIAFSPE